MGCQAKLFTKTSDSLILGYPGQNMPRMLLFSTRCFYCFVNGLHIPKEFDKYTCFYLLTMGLIGVWWNQGLRGGRRWKVVNLTVYRSLFANDELLHGAHYRYLKQSPLTGNKRLGPRFGRKGSSWHIKARRPTAAGPVNSSPNACCCRAGTCSTYSYVLSL